MIGEEDLNDPSEIRRCRGCGCTDEFSCEPDGCIWVEADLCSACDNQEEIPKFHSHRFAMPVYREQLLPRKVA
jgi:hypothetical protein